MRRIVFTADKGGVGKSTAVANTAVGLARAGNKVLVIDVDQQGDVTYAILGARPPSLSTGKGVLTMYSLLMGEVPVEEVVVRAPKYKAVDILPANRDLASATHRLTNDPGGNTVLKFALDELADEAYDFVLIDTAKGMDKFLINAVAAAGEAVIVGEPGSLEIDALDRMVAYVEDVRKKTLLGADRPNVVGILMNRVRGRVDEEVDNVASAAFAEIEEKYPGLLFDSYIPYSDDYKKAISQAISIYEFAAYKRKPTEADEAAKYTQRGRRWAKAYERFVKELIDHGKER